MRGGPRDSSGPTTDAKIDAEEGTGDNGRRRLADGDEGGKGVAGGEVDEDDRAREGRPIFGITIGSSKIATDVANGRIESESKSGVAGDEEGRARARSVGVCCTALRRHTRRGFDVGIRAATAEEREAVAEEKTEDGEEEEEAEREGVAVVLARRSATRNTGRRRRNGAEGERWRRCCRLLLLLPPADTGALTVEVVSIVSVHIAPLSPFLSRRPFLAGAGAAGR